MCPASPARIPYRIGSQTQLRNRNTVVVKDVALLELKTIGTVDPALQFRPDHVLAPPGHFVRRALKVQALNVVVALTDQCELVIGVAIDQFLGARCGFDQDAEPGERILREIVRPVFLWDCLFPGAAAPAPVTINPPRRETATPSRQIVELFVDVTHSRVTDPVRQPAGTDHRDPLHTVVGTDRIPEGLTEFVRPADRDERRHGTVLHDGHQRQLPTIVQFAMDGHDAVIELEQVPERRIESMVQGVLGNVIRQVGVPGDPYLLDRQPLLGRSPVPLT